MAKLNQIIAIEKGVKSRVYGEVTELNKAVQKAELFNGLMRNYEKVDAEGEDLPAERKKVQFTVPDVLRATQRSMVELFNVTARKDWTNCVARADVEVNGSVLVKDAPVTYLLFLEKQLTDMRTFIGNLPVLDEADVWTKDENSGLYRTDPISTHRTKKVQRPIVLYAATPEHPAQTQLITEDILAGYWKQVKQSGAMPKPERERMLQRVETALQAVKQAREKANAIDEVESTPGDAIFAYLFE